MLYAFDILNDMDKLQLSLIENNMELQENQKGFKFYSEGDLAENIYFIREG